MPDSNRDLAALVDMCQPNDRALAEAMIVNALRRDWHELEFHPLALASFPDHRLHPFDLGGFKDGRGWDFIPRLGRLR